MMETNSQLHDSKRIVCSFEVCLPHSFHQLKFIVIQCFTNSRFFLTNSEVFSLIVQKMTAAKQYELLTRCRKGCAKEQSTFTQAPYLNTNFDILVLYLSISITFPFHGNIVTTYYSTTFIRPLFNYYTDSACT